MSSTYHLKRIEVTNDWAINQISFVYDDGQTWSIGNKRGTKDLKEVILDIGEYLVRVTHEKYYQHWCAGAFVEFETNRGRIFSYESYLTTKDLKETVTFKAEPGNEIICLKIKSGVLESIIEQPAEIFELDYFVQGSEWFCLLKKKGELDVEICDYFSKAKAINVFQTIQKYGKSNILLVDVKGNKIFDSFIRNEKKNEALEELKKEAFSRGRLVKRSTVETRMISPKDLIDFCNLVYDWKFDGTLLLTSLTLMFIANFINGYSTIINGHLFSLFSEAALVDDCQILWGTRLLCDLFFEKCPEISDVRTVTVIYMLLVTLTYQICLFVATMAKTRARTTKAGSLQEKLFSHALNQEVGYSDVISGGGLDRVTNAQALLDLATDSFPDLLTSLVRLITTLYLMLYMNAVITLFAIVLLFLTNWIILRPIAKKRQMLQIIKFKVEDQVNEITSDTIASIRTVKSFSKEEEHLNELKRTEEAAKVAETQSSVMDAISNFVSSINERIAYALVLLLSFWMMKNDFINISSGTIGAFLLFYSGLEFQFENLVSVYHRMSSSLTKAEATMEFLRRKPTILNGQVEADQFDFKGQFQIKNVSFEYPSRPGKIVLKNLDLEIPAGKTTAIVGSSGSGKTTIAQLLMRIYDVTQGQIIVDGKFNLKDLDLRKYHDCIAIVSQEPNFFGRSIRENIAYGSRRPLTDEEIFEAAKIANADSFIQSFRTGLDTQVGSGGAQLSGGQLQRIAIARAVIRKPKILVIDEATSSLDTINESVIHSNLRSLMEGKTVIVIAHRLSTVRNADQIIALKDGKVEEIGTHDQLIKIQDGYYASLVKSQM